jgi:small subunit ribosomal protein S4
MSRFTGSIHKKSRRLGFSLLENNKEFLKGKKRNYAPGQHGATSGRKLSVYGEHLKEKQKIAFMYGLNDRQMRNFVRMAKQMKGSNALNLVLLLESRIDNLVYRMGFASTRRNSRQLVNHGHVLIDGKRVDIPSCIVKPDSIISIKAKTQNNKQIIDSLEKQVSILPFVEVDKKALSGKYLRMPERSEIAADFNEAYVIEYYNRLG